MNKYIKWLRHLFMSDEDRCKELIGKTIQVMYKEDDPFKENSYFYIRITEIKSNWCRYDYYDSKGCGVRELTQMCKKMTVYFKNESKCHICKIVNNDVWNINGIKLNDKIGNNLKNINSAD